jgi:outer membrane receptor for monomeric catechols
MKSALFLLLGLALALPPAAEAAAKPRKHAHAHAAARAVPAKAQAQGSYYVPYLTDSFGNRTPIMEIPGSAVVVPQQVIQDQQDISLCGALRNVSGVFCR